MMNSLLCFALLVFVSGQCLGQKPRPCRTPPLLSGDMTVGVVYTINYRNQTCQKNFLNMTFHPSEIPRNASLLSQVILGGSSAPGEGLLVNTWMGVIPETQGKYLATVTEFGCIPVSTLYYTSQTGWIVTR